MLGREQDNAKYSKHILFMSPKHKCNQIYIYTPNLFRHLTHQTITQMALTLHYLSLLLLLCTSTSFSAPPPGLSLEHIDPTLPPVLLPNQTPKCSVVALQQDFADTVGSPPASANYTQPQECPFPWTRVILELSVSASDLQQHRVAAVWIDGAEVLRTTTPTPKAPGAFWKVQKDITRYAALLRRVSNSGGVVSMMLENSNQVLAGVYSANVTLHFYRGGMLEGKKKVGVTAHPSIKGLYREPADLIVPISDKNGYFGSGFWFKVMNDSHLVSSEVKIPRNSYRAALEIFVSYHGDDENWYMNPLRATYLQSNHHNLSTPRANGGFRQLHAAIDGKYIGGHIPFAVIYPNTINPFFWSPVSSLGAFDMPTYDIDVTPFLSLLLDGLPHSISFGVHDALPFWLVSANLHVWVDLWSDSCQAGLIQYSAPPIKFNRNAEWRNIDGQSEINAEGLSRFIGWVSSSKGNLTTISRQKLKYKSQVEVQNRGAIKRVELNNKGRQEVEVVKSHQTLSRVQLLMEAPLQVQTTSMTAAGGAVFEKSRLFHQLEEIVNFSEGQAMTTRQLTDRQDAEGSALMSDGIPVWGSGTTRSQYKYRDETTCYLRAINTAGGLVMVDTKSATCANVADA